MKTETKAIESGDAGLYQIALEIQVDVEVFASAMQVRYLGDAAWSQSCEVCCNERDFGAAGWISTSTSRPTWVSSSTALRELIGRPYRFDQMAMV